MFVDASCLMPMLPPSTARGESLGRSMRAYTDIEFVYYYGNKNNLVAARGSLYIDDGFTTDYAAKQAFGTTYLSCATDTCRIEAELGNQYVGQQTTRNITLRLVNAPLYQSIILDGQGTINYDEFADTIPSWHYNGRAMELVVHMGALVTSVPHVINFDTALSSNTSAIAGLSGVFRRAAIAKELLNDARETPGENTVNAGALQRLASLPSLISAQAGTLDAVSVGIYLSRVVLNFVLQFDALTALGHQLHADAKAELQRFAPTGNNTIDNARWKV
jgi:hypothetical protein